MENRKIILALFILASLVIGLYAGQIVQYVYVNFYQVRRAMVGLEILREGIPVLFGLGTFAFLYYHKATYQFVEESVTELKKVTWPGREDVVRSTTVVIICIMVASAILATFDVIWGKVMGVLLS